MVSLHVGVCSPTTLYELIIGKTLPVGPDENPDFDLAYFKDRALMVNLQNRSIALFRVPTQHHSDIYHAVPNKTDQYIITEWLNSFGSIDAFLKSDASDFTVTISGEEWRALHPSPDDVT
jgi:hypothetical protein